MAELAKLIIGEPSIEQCFEMVRVNLQSLCIQGNCGLVLTLFPGCIALCVESFCLGLQLLVELEFDLLWSGLLLLLVLCMCLRG